MTNTKDFSEMMKNMMSGGFPVDMTAMEEAFKTSAALNEKLSSVALEAASKSAEVSNKWAKDTLSKLNQMSRAKAEPADYTKSFSDFASATAEAAAENMAAFAEVAKKVQMDTVELLMAAGKDITEDASAAMKKATDGVTAAAKKATDTAAKATK